MVGDVLVLTKPLGTQIAVNAHQWLEDVSTEVCGVLIKIEFCKRKELQAIIQIGLKVSVLVTAPQA